MGAVVIEFMLRGDTELIGRFSSASASLVAALKRKLDVLDLQLQRHIQADKLHGQVLHMRTGNLFRSIVVRPAQDTEGEITGAVVQGREAPYGIVHEYGGTFTIPGHNASNSAKTWWVREHDATYPARSFMRTSFSEFHDRIVEGLNEALGSEV